MPFDLSQTLCSTFENEGSWNTDAFLKLVTAFHIIFGTNFKTYNLNKHFWKNKKRWVEFMFWSGIEFNNLKIVFLTIIWWTSRHIFKPFGSYIINLYYNVFLVNLFNYVVQNNYATQLDHAYNKKHYMLWIHELTSGHRALSSDIKP